MNRRYLPALVITTRQPAPATRTLHLVKAGADEAQALCGRAVEVAGLPWLVTPAAGSAWQP